MRRRRLAVVRLGPMGMPVLASSASTFATDAAVPSATWGHRVTPVAP